MPSAVQAAKRPTHQQHQHQQHLHLQSSSLPSRQSSGPGAGGSSSLSLSSSSSSSSYFSGQRKHAKQRRTKKNNTKYQRSISEGRSWSTQSSGMDMFQSEYDHPDRIQRVPLINSPDLQLRFLMPTDLPEVKGLCKEWFPIDYPDAWYNDITSNDKFYSMACVYHNRIIGLVVAEIKDFCNVPKEDSDLLETAFFNNRTTKIGYILSLGVLKDYRNNGIASFMLDTLLSHLTSGDQSDVCALYLHVLTTNTQAIQFYEHRGFTAHRFLPYYYNIKGKKKDGYTYVLYLNGGHRPWSVLEYMVQCCHTVLFSWNTFTLTRLGFRKVSNFAWYQAMPRIRQMAQSSAAVFS